MVIPFFAADADAIHTDYNRVLGRLNKKIMD
jgi:hypothetical protein